jgi:hypothetical protein
MARFLLIAALLFASKPAVSAELWRSHYQEATSALRTILVLIDLSAPQAEAQNRRFATELQLVLDDFEVVLAEVSRPESVKIDLPDQMERVRLIAQRHEASLVAWVETSASGALALRIVFLGKGRAVLRTVDGAPGPEAEAGLALAARELLKDAELLRTTERATTPMFPSAPLVVEEEKKRRLAITAAAQGSGGIAGVEGPSLYLGGVVGGRLWPAGNGWSLLLSLGFLSGPIGTAQQATISGWRLEPALALGYQWTVRRFHLGPMVGVLAPYTASTFELEDAKKEKVSWWSCRIFGGVGFKIDFGEIAFLFLDGAMGFNTNKEVFEKLAHEKELETPSENQTIAQTPTVAWDVVLGLGFFVF